MPVAAINRFFDANAEAIEHLYTFFRNIGAMITLTVPGGMLAFYPEKFSMQHSELMAVLGEALILFAGSMSVFATLHYWRRMEASGTDHRVLFKSISAAAGFSYPLFAVIAAIEHIGR
ncbi:MAG TPA: hypothetical protein VHE37_15620 [Nevskiaceae bacterium]|nr:hypothetical protein [Nevskiaceae bacterium]